MLRTVVGLAVTALIAVAIFMAFNNRTVATSGDTASDDTAAAIACVCEQCEEGCKCCSSEAVDCDDCVCKSCGCEACADKS